MTGSTANGSAKPLNAGLINSLPPPTRTAFLNALTANELDFLLHHWPFWARADQLAPTDTDWTTWLILGGRGAGKTRAGAEWIRMQVEGDTPLGPGNARRIALVAQDYAEGRAVMIEGPSGLLALTPQPWRPTWRKSLRELEWPNGAKATLFSAEDPAALRGPQHDTAWVDEFAKFARAEETFDMLQFGLRLGARPRQVVTTTPRPVPALKRLMNDPTTMMSHATTFANKAHLAPAFFDAVIARFEGTHLGRQELMGELVEDVPGALWARAQIESTRIADAPDLMRIVVAIDPPVTSGPRADECGIVAAGVSAEGAFFVLADHSVQGLSPAAWAARAVALYRALEADRIVAEVNQGGELVRGVLEQAGHHLPLHIVRASRGKIARAEPIAALYERGLVHHVGTHPELEDQMCSYTGEGGKSPDRMDALVWALTDLTSGGAPRIRSLNA